MLPFIGPSYSLDVRKADCQRTVNMFVAAIESGAKGGKYLEPVPGLVEFADLGAEVRGRKVVNGTLYMVAGDKLYEVASDGAETERGTLLTSTGRVGMAYGITQLVIVDGANGYVYTLETDAFERITDTDWRGSNTVEFIDNFYTFVVPGTQQFYWSEINDASSLDALNFASAEGSPDSIVTQIADHRQLMLLGTDSVEIWEVVGGDSTFARNNGAAIETGCEAAHSVCKLDNSIYWLAADERGGAQVVRLQGYTAVRVSTHAIEQLLQSVGDRSGATAYSYQQGGHSFYCLNVPGLDTTLCFDVATGTWHDRAEWDNGYSQHRGTIHAYAYGKHLLGAADGKVYELSASATDNAGDPLVRDRISPHSQSPDFRRVRYSSFELDCTVGVGKSGGTEALVMLRYSDDGGHEWSSWRTTPLGAIGERKKPPLFLRCGMARDRVWHVRVTDATDFAITGAHVGTS